MRIGITDPVLNFPQWCELNGFSEATGRRVIKRGEGPAVLQLSARRIGIRNGHSPGRVARSFPSDDPGGRVILCYLI